MNQGLLEWWWAPTRKSLKSANSKVYTHTHTNLDFYIPRNVPAACTHCMTIKKFGQVVFHVHDAHQTIVPNPEP